MDLIKEREKRTIRRKIAKSKFDNMINLASGEDDGILLLDEGSVVTTDEKLQIYFKKGSIQRYLNSLSDDFVGYIKYGHSDFANYPILLGQFAKSDLTIRDRGDGRSSLYVKPTWFDTYLLKDIKAMPFSVGVSIEASALPDKESSESLGVPVYEDFFISGFAVVGDAGNVNSSGIRLNGGSKLDLKEITKALEAQSEIDLSALRDALREPETVEEETVDEVAEETVEASVEEEETEEETSMDDVLAKVTELTERVESLENENLELKGQVETLTAEKNEVSEKLSAKEGEINDFLKAFSGLELKVSDPVVDKPETTKMSIAMDGIGE